MLLSTLSFLIHLFAFGGAAGAAWVIFHAIWQEPFWNVPSDFAMAGTVIVGTLTVLLILGLALFRAAPIAVTF